MNTIRVCGRAASGVKLMRLQEGARVAGVARAEQEEAEDEAELADGAAPGEVSDELDMTVGEPDDDLGNPAEEL